MKYDFDGMIDRTQAISIKWSAEQRMRMFGESDIIPMGIADMDYKVSPAIAAAVRKRAAHETYGYSYPSGEYLQACAGWQKRRNGWEIQPDWIVFTPGVNMALVCAIEMYAQPGEGVIIQSPVYYPYYDYVNKTKRRIALNELINHDGRYEINFAQLEELAGDILAAGEVSPEMSYKNHEISCYPEKGMVEFLGPGWGLGSSTRYTGFYYSASGDPLGFQGSQPTFTRDGEGWRWEEPAGDNWEYTREITPNWYWFEMHF